jgi:hypothetical protein
MAARLQVGAIATPVVKFGWIAGLTGLVITSAIVPALQAGVKQVPSQITEPQSLTTYHTGLNGTMSIGSGAWDYPEDVINQVTRGANQAFLGDGNSLFSYLSVPLSGDTVIGPLKYADLNCSISSTPGTVSSLPGNYFYNFTITNYAWQDMDAYFTRVDFTAVMYNNTHFLTNVCSLKPVTGNCYCLLNNGTATYDSLQCIATADLVIPTYSNQDLRFTTASGFNAIATAFINIFKGNCRSDISGRPQPNSTFTELAMNYGTSGITFPSDLISHMRRVAWNTPFTSKNVSIANDQVGVQIQSTRNITILQINSPFIISVLVVSWLLAVSSVFYLLSVRTRVGRLQVDTIIHSLTLSGKNGPGISDSGLAGLNQVRKEFDDKICKFGEVAIPGPGFPGRVGIDEGAGRLSEGYQYL